jgi:SAM-dependent methyltransferase
MDSTKMTTEMDNLKARLRATWTSGDFGRIATSYDAGARAFVDRLGLKAGDQVLDVACGTGNTAIPAARTGASVTGVDLAPNLIEQATAWNDAEGLTAEFDVGDAEAMPYDDNSFDVVMTMFGAMFTPRPEVTAVEMKRVCRPGGLITMANWTPESFVGQMFKTTGKHVTPPAGMPSPLLWGSDDAVSERFADGIADLKTTRRTLFLVFPFGPAETVEHFRLYYGPSQKAFESIDAAAQSALRNDLEALWSKHNQATDGTTKVESEYLDIRAIRA